MMVVCYVCYLFTIVSPSLQILIFVTWTDFDANFIISLLQYVVVSRLQELALSLSLKCLSFDFVGTSIDESSEEFGTVQVQMLYYITSVHILVCVVNNKNTLLVVSCIEY